MRQTLRRSCAACARSKHSCDLRTPRCSRCIKRNVPCAYANEPLTASPDSSDSDSAALTRAYHVSSTSISTHRLGSIDPFESYPQTRLPRQQVQRLIHSFLHNIAFQYYPLDLNATSNPFIISWWPLALGDPALFHVSLQTASLYEELLAQKGFQMSEILMADSVALLRRKVEDASLAVQDGTMNSVITLATIEFGKGNTKVAEMHVDGVKRLVNMRGGIQSVMQTSPLTARMVSWVSMLIMGQPQFETQNDDGFGNGISPIAEWQLEPTSLPDGFSSIDEVFCNSEVGNVFGRLRAIFARAQRTPLPSTRLHDLACFVIHRLLLSTPDALDAESSSVAECIRYATVLYMFIIQGPTYYSHEFIMSMAVDQLLQHLKRLQSTSRPHDTLDVWLVAIGMVASTGTAQYRLFTEMARSLGTLLHLNMWDDIMVCVANILWLDMPHSEDAFRSHWDAIINPISPDNSIKHFLSSPGDSISSGQIYE